MKKSKFSDSQIVAILKEGEALRDKIFERVGKDGSWPIAPVAGLP